LSLFGDRTKAIKLKTPRELQRVLNMTLDKIQAILDSDTPLGTQEVENEKVELEKLV